MAVCIDAETGKKIKCPRPSPRTQGVDAAGNVFQKYGTQQLSYVEGDPSKGVVERDVGKNFETLTTTLASPFVAGGTTTFSRRFQAGITGATPTALRPQALIEQEAKLKAMGAPTFDWDILGTLFNPTPPPPPTTASTCKTCDSDKCQECDAWDVGCELSHMAAGTCTSPATTGPTCKTCDSDKCQECDAWDVGCELSHMMAGTCTPPPIDVNGCECEACKNGTGKCSDKCGKCNEWDLGCEATCGITPDPNFWLYVKIILAVIGIGILLWLLRPLFGVAKNITEK